MAGNDKNGGGENFSGPGNEPALVDQVSRVPPADMPDEIDAVERLRSTMLAIEARYSVTPNDDPGYADRAAAGHALDAVMTFLWEVGIERRPLSRLQDALVGVGRGQQPAAMFCPPVISNRRGDRLGVQVVKAELAAIMEIQHWRGRKHERAAAQWVVDHMPRDLQLKLSSKPITARAVEGWRERWGGEHGEPGHPRDCYLRILAAAEIRSDVGPDTLSKTILREAARLTAQAAPKSK